MGQFDPSTELGPRLRKVREARGLSARELARRLTCSPSLISQIERGLSAPSVGMLYALASELRTSLDFLFGASAPGDFAGATAGDQITLTAHGDGRFRPRPGGGELPADGRAGGHVAGGHVAGGDVAGRDVTGGDVTGGEHGIVQRAGKRRTIDLASGVRWERLTPGPDGRVDFLEVIYEPSGHSTDARRLLRHDGYEYGVIMTGRLTASVGFDTFELGPGDSIAFDSSTPHQYWNATAEPVRAVWVVVHAQPGRA